MKKGVFGNAIFLMVLVVMFVYLLQFVFAEDTDLTDEGGDEEAEVFDYVLQDGGVPLGSGSAAGYWLAETHAGYAYGGESVYYSTRGSEPLFLPAGEYIPSIYDDIWLEDRDDGETWERDIKDVYLDFKVRGTDEIQYVTFVLDPLAFILEADGLLYASHKGTPAFTNYQSGCVECTRLDTPDTYSCEPSLPDANTCIRFNILDREGCSEVADFNPQFCEGVSGAGANAGTSGTAAIDPSVEGVGGRGGCQPSPYETAGNVRPYGRDWYPYYNAGTMFSSDFLDSEWVGPCCGNDDEDPGAVAKHKNYPGDYPNAYICINDTSVNPSGEFRWSYAQDTGAFRILGITRFGREYDAVSNSNNWFVCNTGDDSISDWYTRVDDDGDGILLDEYEGLPEPAATLASHTDVFEGGGGGGIEDGVNPNDWPDDSGDDYIDATIDEETFSNTNYSVTGAATVTVCDKDGDGYDGHWTASPLDTSPAVENDWAWQDPTGECQNPHEPYDCDDYPDDDPVDLPISRMRNPGVIDYCIGGTDYDLDCNPDTPCIQDPTQDTTPEDMFANPEAQFLTPRFICHNTDDRGEFAECCGWDLSFCFNPQEGRREGSAIHTLREFDKYKTVMEGSLPQVNKTNFVLMYGINTPPPQSTYGSVNPDEVFSLALYSANNDLNITDWSHYKNLEFYIWMTSNYEVELWIGQYSGVGDPEIRVNYIFPFKRQITDYVVNEPGLRKWLHVVIPVEDIFVADFRPEVLMFASNVRRLMSLQTEVSLPYDTKKYSNIVGIDKIFLRPKEDLPAGADNLYCSGTWPPVWLTDLDDTSSPAGSEVEQPAGRDACESIPSYGWTGSRCCGDDTGNDTVPGRVGASTDKETYNDSRAGCWAGNLIADNSRVMLVKYRLSYSGFDDEVVHSCNDRSCTYDLPQMAGVVVQNDYASIYDLFFVNGLASPIGRGSVSPNDHSYLKVDNLPLQVMYLDGQYWGCNASGFIKDMDNTETGGKLISGSNLLGSDGDVCAVKGNYFCDQPGGRNAGWDAEPLSAYPLALEEGVTSSYLAQPDGSELQLPAALGTTVPATYRNQTKRSYNLVRNGGFEDV